MCEQDAIAAAFESADKDGNGSIDFEEFTIMLADLGIVCGVPMARKVCLESRSVRARAPDVRANVSRSSGAAAKLGLELALCCSPACVLQMFEKVDRNHDGDVSKQEFTLFYRRVQSCGPGGSGALLCSLVSVLLACSRLTAARLPASQILLI